MMDIKTLQSAYLRAVTERDNAMFQLTRLKAERDKAVEVVRCGECERRNKAADLSNTILCKYLHNLQMPKNGFCSYGERSVDNEDD